MGRADKRFRKEDAMKQNWITRALIAALVCGVVAPAPAMAATQKEKALEKQVSRPVEVSKARMTPKIETLEGAIAQVNAKGFFGSSLTVLTSDKKKQSVKVDRKQTAIWRQGQEVRLDQLKVGDKVRVRYTKGSIWNVAKSIDTTPAMSSKPASASPSRPAAGTSAKPGTTTASKNK
jgi:NOL1/NOP2/fmu family ribosome biogenesis protein